MANHNLKPTSTKSNVDVLRYSIKGQLDRNKSAFISLVTCEGQSDKRTFSNKTASTKLLTVAPLVAVTPGDLLGLFRAAPVYESEPNKSCQWPGLKSLVGLFGGDGKAE